jgi:hypothetical protein
MTSTRVFCSPRRAKELSSPRTGPYRSVDAMTWPKAGMNLCCAAMIASSGVFVGWERAGRAATRRRMKGTLPRRQLRGKSLATKSPVGQSSATDEASVGNVVANAVAIAPPYHSDLSRRYSVRRKDPTMDTPARHAEDQLTCCMSNASCVTYKALSYTRSSEESEYPRPQRSDNNEIPGGSIHLGTRTVHHDTTPTVRQPTSDLIPYVCRYSKAGYKYDLRTCIRSRRNRRKDDTHPCSVLRSKQPIARPPVRQINVSTARIEVLGIYSPVRGGLTCGRER